MTANGETGGDRPNQDRDIADINQLNALGNEAIALGLIVGHGYHQGQYEILHRGEAVTLTPAEATQYLQALIQSAR
ncbi:MAG: hypothetical protein O3C67_04490 [Cyanobacteria bacterium]|nr:hypothetical protein [Cyanobacteriota bacterium]